MITQLLLGFSISSTPLSFWTLGPGLNMVMQRRAQPDWQWLFLKDPIPLFAPSSGVGSSVGYEQLKQAGLLKALLCLSHTLFYYNIILQSPPKGKKESFPFEGASLVAQRLKRLPAMWETWVRSLGQEDPLEKEKATHSSILAWRIPWTEEPGRLQSVGSQRVGHDWMTSLSLSGLEEMSERIWKKFLWSKINY